MNGRQQWVQPRALASVALIVLAAGTALAAPANADPLCGDGLAATAAELQDELACATASTAPEYTITLTANFAVPPTYDGAYDGSADLVLDGGSHHITGATTDGPAGALLEPGGIEAGPQFSTFNVEIRNLEATGFISNGVVSSLTTGELTLDSVEIRDSRATEVSPTLLPPARAVVSGVGPIAVRSSSFIDNVGLLGGAVSLANASQLSSHLPAHPAVTVDGSLFQGNAGTLAAGAIFAVGDVNITNSLLASNSAPDGGAVMADGALSSSLTIDNSAFVGNTTSGSGGALVTNMDSVITGSTFAENSAAGDAGAILTKVQTVPGTPIFQPSLTITDSEIARSSADGRGSAILTQGDMTLNGVTVADNDGGEAVVYGQGTTVIDRATFANNSPVLRAPLLLYAPWPATASVTNSTFTGNAVPHATGVGAMQLIGEEALLSHNTFSDNVGGMAAHLVASVMPLGLTLHGNAFTSDGTIPSCVITAATVSTSNFDADGSCTADWSGPGDIGDGLDAILGVLADNGGPTETLLPREGSPLIDAVTTGIINLAVDQRGIARPQGDRADIGAVEVMMKGPNPSPTPTPSPTPSPTPTPTPSPTPTPGDKPTTPPGDNQAPETGRDSAPGDKNASKEAGDAGTIAFQVKTDAGTLYGTATAAVAVTDINWTSTANLTGAPADTALPYGAAGFTVEVPEPGASITVTLTAPTPFTAAYKVSDGEWSKIDGATFSADGTTVTYTLTDGGPFDEDGRANGFIVDPVALAVQATFTG